MKHLKLIMLFCIGVLFIASKSFGQANPFINVLPSNSGIVAVGDTIDIIVTIGNTGPVSAVPQAKLRPIIQVPTSVTFLPNAQQVGLPSGWTILSNTGSQLRLCNSADAIPVNTSRTIILKAQGVTVSSPQTFAGNINFGNGTTCAAGTSVAGDLITDNSALSTVQVVAPATTLNLNVFIQGYWDGVSGMIPVLANSSQTTTPNACDSIDVFLKDANPPYATVASTRAVLNTNGTCTAQFAGSYTGSYYIAIEHRSAICTWSANPVSMAGTPSYNFTTSDAQSYGPNMVQVATGVWAFYSGDCVKDAAESINIDDITSVELDNSNFVFGYTATDIDGSGDVNLSDFPSLELNINAFIFCNRP